jgi:hypothetical protein
MSIHPVSTQIPDPALTGATTSGPSPEDLGRVRALETAVVGLLTIQLVVGYEWFVSGLTKLWRGGFATGLADELSEKSQGVTGWYRSFLDNTVIPHAWGFGWLILAAELAVGIALIGAAALFLVRRHELRFSTRQVLLAITVLASVGGIIMNISFHLANGNPHPWLIPNSGFDEGVDLDSLMPLVQLAFAITATKLYLVGRRVHRRATP